MQVAGSPVGNPSLQEMWDQEQCPIVNGIIFATGAVRHLEMDPAGRASGHRGHLIVGSETSLAELEKSGRLSCTYYTEMGEAIDQSLGIRVVCGGGGMGSDGFIALLRLPANCVEWIAFFDFANPFTDVRVVDNNIETHNNLGEEWSLSIEAPQSITLKKA
jgi:hypothetical protein